MRVRKTTPSRGRNPEGKGWTGTLHSPQQPTIEPGRLPLFRVVRFHLGLSCLLSTLYSLHSTLSSLLFSHCPQLVPNCSSLFSHTHIGPTKGKIKQEIQCRFTTRTQRCRYHPFDCTVCIHPSCVPMPKLFKGQDIRRHPRSKEGKAPNDVVDMVQKRLIEKTRKKEIPVVTRWNTGRPLPKVKSLRKGREWSGRGEQVWRLPDCHYCHPAERIQNPPHCLQWRGWGV